MCFSLGLFIAVILFVQFENVQFENESKEGKKWAPVP